MKTLAAAILFSGVATALFAQQLEAAAPSPEPMPGFHDGNAGARKLRYSNCRIFASRYPKLVAGMVLVDTSDADFWLRMKAPAPGLSRSAEWIDLEANAALLRKAMGLGKKPLIVVTASPTAPDWLPSRPATTSSERSRNSSSTRRWMSSTR